MTLWDWMGVHHPERGGTSWLMRASGVTFPTIRKAMSGLTVDESAATRLSAATGGAVSVGELVSPPRRRDRKEFLERTARKRTVSP